jgi:hypothetical protein
MTCPTTLGRNSLSFFSPIPRVLTLLSEKSVLFDNVRLLCTFKFFFLHQLLLRLSTVILGAGDSHILQMSR